MKIFNLRVLSLISIVCACAATHAQTPNSFLTIGDKKLTLQLNTKCSQPRPSHKELAQYLYQYDPSHDPRSDIRDVTPWTAQEKKMVKAGLVEDGFQYPNGQKSVITWMDFDGDGICDFTASAGIGGMKPIDRMFLFRGLPNGKFKLMDSYLEYMDSSITLVPYIPVQVSGEKLPVIIGGGILMQWQSERKKFAVCESSAVIAERQKRLGRTIEKSKTVLQALCSHQQDINRWAENQLPHQNSFSMLLQPGQVD